MEGKASGRASFGELFRQLRLRRGETLRSFCINHGFDPGNISKLERGKLTPPQAEKLAEYAKALDLVEGTDEWYEFYDQAAIARRELPRDLTEQELLDQLPVVFRRLRGQKISPEELETLIEIIKES